MLLLLWSLPVSMLPQAVAKPHATALPTPNEAQLKLNATENYGKLPLSFEANMGQSAKPVRFLSRGKGYTLFLTPNEAVCRVFPNWKFEFQSEQRLSRHA